MAISAMPGLGADALPGYLVICAPHQTDVVAADAQPTAGSGPKPALNRWPRAIARRELGSYWLVEQAFAAGDPRGSYDGDRDRGEDDAGDRRALDGDDHRHH